MWGGGEQKALERAAAEGESPVGEAVPLPGQFLSSAGHEKPCVNPAGPSAKAKYSWETDSEPVP